MFKLKLFFIGIMAALTAYIVWQSYCLAIFINTQLEPIIKALDVAK